MISTLCLGTERHWKYIYTFDFYTLLISLPTRINAGCWRLILDTILERPFSWYVTHMEHCKSENLNACYFEVKIKVTFDLLCEYTYKSLRTRRTRLKFHGAILLHEILKIWSFLCLRIWYGMTLWYVADSGNHWWLAIKVRDWTFALVLQPEVARWKQ